MTNGSICCIRRNAAISHAYDILKETGFHVTAYPARSTAFVLLPVPSFPAGTDWLEELLPQLYRDTVIIGGNLDIPLLKNRRTVDFLKDPYYLAQNAAITAECALRMVEEKKSLQGCPVLIFGWGRIGKCLGKLLQSRGAEVTIAARKHTDLAMIRALGYESISAEAVDKDLTAYQVILNTIPAMVAPEMVTQSDAVILELASTAGMSGSNIIPARGLPGKMAPEQSGKLIAETLIRLLKEELP